MATLQQLKNGSPPAALQFDGKSRPAANAAPPVSVVIPVYNETGGVAAQIKTVAGVLAAHNFTYEIIAVDDGSADDSAQEALLAGARVLQHPQNRGYGAALKTGILAARYDSIVIIDADGTYPADQIPALLAQLEQADMVVGARTGQHVHIPLVRRPAKWVLRWLAARIAERHIPDLNSGLRAFRRECVKQYFPILSNRFSFTTTSTLALLADDYHVVYHPINYYPRVGQSKITPRHFMDFMILIFRIAMLFQPLKIFVPFAFFFGLMGALKTVFDVVTVIPRHAGGFDWSVFYQPAISTSAILFLLVGFQLLMIGMVADGVVRRVAQHARPAVPSAGVRSVELIPPPEHQSAAAPAVSNN
jgi:glycosyltransferase involved in cell wall biosynthesis